MNENLKIQQSIFDRAIEIEDDQDRDAFIKDACKGDVQLEQQVSNLLRADLMRGDVLDISEPGHADVYGATVTARKTVESPGTRIGAYKLLQQIGEGGFGVVYMAEQHEPVRRKVALKIIKPGMDTKEVVARFESERQALALMDHPHVARVFDGGTTDTGRPYFVMELVHGTPITEFCDEQKLSTHDRLRLFADVCRAVQHAHHKGIIHRDLKPSNIMITLHDDKPVVKVIDFGISKAMSRQLTDKTLFTAYGQMVGTPLYMSPEQAQLSGLDIDTRSDVYSLGVLLYELLTGTTPFDKETFQKSGFDELRRIIREEDPPRPSARVTTLKAETLSTFSEKRKTDPRKLSSTLRGELDWIVMKALEKDRNRRYDSAGAFAGDVERFLNDDPVHACPPSAWYRFRKYTRRHRTNFIIASTALVAVVVLVIGATVFAFGQKELADERADFLVEQTAEREKADDRAAATQMKYEASTARLANALLGEAAGLRKSRVQGYRIGVNALLREATQLDTPALSREAIRNEILEYVGDPVSLPAKFVKELPKIPIHVPQRYRRLLPEKVRDKEIHEPFFRKRAVSKDGVYFARVVDDKIEVYRDGTLLKTVSPALGTVNDVAISHDSEHLAAVGSDGMAVWTLPNLEGTQNGWAKGYSNIAFHPNLPLFIACRERQRIDIWTLQPFQQVGSFQHDIVTSAYFSADGTQLCVQGYLRIPAEKQDAKSSVNKNDKRAPRIRAVGAFPRQILPFRSTPERRQLDAHKQGVWALAWHPDGRHLYSASEEMTCWDVVTGIFRSRSTKCWSRIETIAVGPEGELIAVADAVGAIKIISRETGNVLAQAWSPSCVWRLEFGPNAETLVAATHRRGLHAWLVSRRGGAVSLRKLDEAAMKPMDKRPMTGLAIHPNGRDIACQVSAPMGTAEVFRYRLGSAKPLRLTDSRTVLRRTATAVPNSTFHAKLRFFKSGTRLKMMTSPIASAPGHVGVAMFSWPAFKVDRLFSLANVKKKSIQHSGSRLLEVSRDGRLGAYLPASNRVSVLDFERGRIHYRLPVESDDVTCLRFSDDGRKLAVGLENGSISIWNLDEVDARLAEFGVLQRDDSASRWTPSTVKDKQPEAIRPATSAELLPIAGLFRIRQLYNSQHPSSSIADNDGVTKLTSLNLSRSNTVWNMEGAIYDRDLHALDQLKNLKKLNLHRTLISDNGLVSIARATSLESLTLSRNHIHGSGLANLLKLKSLRVLDLSNTSIDLDRHLDTLLQFRHLKKLDISYCPSTPEAVERIKRALGNECDIVYSPYVKPRRIPSASEKSDSVDLLKVFKSTKPIAGRVARTPRGCRFGYLGRGQAVLDLPAEIPGEYDLRLKVIRRPHRGFTGLRISFPWKIGGVSHRLYASLGNWFGTGVAGYDSGESWSSKAAMSRIRYFPLDAEVTTVIKVRKERFSLEIGEKTLFTIPVPKKLKGANLQKLAGLNAGFAFQTSSDFEITELLLTPHHSASIETTRAQQKDMKAP